MSHLRIISTLDFDKIIGLIKSVPVDENYEGQVKSILESHVESTQSVVEPAVIYGLKHDTYSPNESWGKAIDRYLKENC